MVNVYKIPIISRWGEDFLETKAEPFSFLRAQGKQIIIAKL